MKLWPFSRKAPVETRQQGGAGSTDAVTRALIAEATGGTVRDASATAALEAAAGAYARAFAIAEVSPSTAVTMTLTPALLALAGRDLIRRGEFVWVIEVAGDGVMLLPCGSWDVRGGWDPETWFYRVDLFGPSGNTTRLLPGAAVIHGRYSTDPARPWFGISPMEWVSLTGRLHASVEDALADESAGTRGHVLPVPAGPESGEVDADGEPIDELADLRKDIANLRGKTALVETTSAGWSEGKVAAPLSDWKARRIGASPPAPVVDLRSDSAQSVLAACGVPPSLFHGGDAATKGESWRQFLHGSVQPVAMLLAAELADKLDAPDLRLSFDRLFASDLQGRARSFQSMRNGGIELPDARRLAGLNNN